MKNFNASNIYEVISTYVFFSQLSQKEKDCLWERCSFEARTAKDIESAVIDIVNDWTSQ